MRKEWTDCYFAWITHQVRFKNTNISNGSTIYIPSIIGTFYPGETIHAMDNNNNNRVRGRVE